jgi:hypothetical protein
MGSLLNIFLNLFNFFSSVKLNFPEKTSVFPAQTKKKEKIGTIFWEQTFRFVTPKGPF